MDMSRRIFLWLVTLLAGCGFLNQLQLDIEEAIRILDRAINELQEDFTNLEAVVTRVAHDFPEQVNETVRTSLQHLALRIVGQVGVEFRCNIDFLGARVLSVLIALRTELLGGPPAEPLPPALCSAVPAQISLRDAAENRSEVSFYGYDLDHRDRNGNLVQVALLRRNGERYVVPESAVGRTSHYQITLNAQLVACELRDAVKIQLLYDGVPMGAQGEVTVSPWLPRMTETPWNFGVFPLYPDHTGGDGDLFSHDNEPFLVVVRVEFRITPDRHRIEMRGFLRLFEERDDWTELSRESSWEVGYQAPPNQVIVGFTPNAGTSVEAQVNYQGVILLNRPAGEVVSSITVWGDRDGDEPGWSHMDVHFHQVMVQLLEEQAPDVCR